MGRFDENGLFDYQVPVLALGISYKKASIDERKKFVCSKYDYPKVLLELKDIDEVTECVVISTCNRTEIFLSYDAKALPNQVFAKVESFIADFTNTSIHEIHKSFMYYIGTNAIKHLISVAGGLESLNIGEYEIAGQVKDAYAIARNNGYTGFYLNTVFQQSIAYAKNIHSSEEFLNSGISYSAQVIKLIRNQMKKLNVENIKVLIIGASGSLGKSIVKALLKVKGVQIYASVHRHVLEVAPNNKLHIINYSERYSYIQECDVVISTTSSPHYTITFENCSKSLALVNHQILFVDLAVPNDIEEDIQTIDNCELINFANFENDIKRNQDIRLNGCKQAINNIGYYVYKIVKILKIHEAQMDLQDVKATLEKQSGLDFFYQLQKVASIEELNDLYDLAKRAIAQSRDGQKAELLKQQQLLANLSNHK